MVHGSHGSLERTPGALFRSMGALWGAGTLTSGLTVDAG